MNVFNNNAVMIELNIDRFNQVLQKEQTQQLFGFSL